MLKKFINSRFRPKVLAISISLLTSTAFANGGPSVAWTYTVDEAITDGRILDGLDTIAVTDSGEIYISGSNYATAVDSSGDSNTIIIQGRLLTDSFHRYGVNNSGNTNITSVSGVITTYGDYARGVVNDGESNSTTVSGNITTSGDYAFGVVNDGESNSTTVSGNITTSGDDAHGVVNIGESNSTTVSGVIATSGDSSNGVYNSGDRNLTSVSGVITTSGDFANSVINFGNNISTSVSGEITTSGNQDITSVRNYGDSHSTTITGVVSASGETVHVVYNQGDFNSSTVSGNVTSSGYDTYGVLNFGDNNSTSVSGDITSSGDRQSTGVYNGGDNNSINVTGVISTSSGDYTYGVYNIGDNNSTTVSGVITTLGESAYGIVTSGNDNHVNISGTVKSSGSRSMAIFNLSGTNNIYTFTEGVRIIGDIRLDDYNGIDGNTLRFDVGSTQSYVFDTSGSWELEDLDGREVVAGSAMAVGIGGAETADELQYSRLSNLNNSIVNSSASNIDDNAWVNPYYSSSERKADASDPTVEDYKATSQGFVAGIPVVGKKYGVLFGLDKTNLDIHDKTQEIDVTSFKAGLYLPELASYDDVRITGKALVGYNQHDMTRQVLVNTNTTTGITNYTADYNSWEVTAGIDAQLKRPVNTSSGTQMIAGAGLDLVYEAIESYSETANFAWDSRKVLQGVANASLGFTNKHHNGVISHAIATIKHRNVLSGKTTDYSINGTAVTFSGGDFSDTIAQLNVGATYKAKDDVQLTLDVNASQSSNDITNMGAAAKVSWRF